jgi:hypothetical protein
MKGEGGAGSKDQLRYSQSPEKCKGKWHEINKDERRGRSRATDKFRYIKSPEKCKDRVARDQ